MNLEDHVGDIIRKARSMAKVTIEAAAAEAGLTARELRTLEQTGTCATPPDLASLAGLIGLKAQKLEGIANGWVPAPVDLNRWRKLRVVTTADEDMSVNCFLVWDAATRQAALFDTGFDVAPVLAEIAASELKLEHVFITHGHSDHVDGLPELSRRFPAARLHWDAPASGPNQRNVPGECIQLGQLQITHRLTPGHAPDGVTYVINGWPDEAPQVVIVGDALFAGSMGLAPGAWELARRAVREEVLSLAGSTLICPGHGPLTTVGEEVKHNPFF